jgi:hypothetical protein
LKFCQLAFFIQIKLNECRNFSEREEKKKKRVHEMNMEKSDGKLSAQHVYTLGVGNEN